MFRVIQETTASSHWTYPAVDKRIYENVLYLPIADDAIKTITINPIKEKLIDLLKINNPRIKSIAIFNSKYQKTHSEYSKIRFGVYKKLLKMLEFLPKSIGIVYIGGLRPLYIQKEYFDKKFRELISKLQNKELAYQETIKHVSPFIDNIPTHATGAAIDMTLFSTNNQCEQLIDMGKIGVISNTNDQQETFSKKTSIEQRNNRLMLLNAATKAGLVNYGFEWWHYSYGDKVWAYVKKHNEAIYGLAVEDDPILLIDKKYYLKSFSE